MQTNNCFVLIRGLLREARHWGKFADILRHQFPAYTVLTPDIPGNGRLHTLTSPNRIPSMTDALRQQITVTHPINLIAISMGGMIAIDWMQRYPDEIRSAVLINTSARPISPFYRRLRWQTYPTLINLLFSSAPQREQTILALTSNRHRHNSELLKTWQQWQRQYPVSAGSAKNQLCAAATFSLPAKPQQPMLIINSKADRLVDSRCSQQLHNIWQTQYLQHETAGHDLPLDEPVWLARVIRQWFDADMK